MRHYGILGAALAAALLLSSPARAEEAAAPVSSAVHEMAEMEEAERLALMWQGFLDEMDVGGGAVYKPIQMEEEMGAAWKHVRLPVGQLQIQEDGLFLTAHVVNIALYDPQADMLLGGLFDIDEQGRISPAGLAALAAFNQAAGQAGPWINEKLLELIAQVRKNSNEPIPYSIAHVELRSIEPARRLEGTPAAVYTAGTRLLLYFDGWIFPLYIRTYLYEDAPSYRWIALISADSEKEAVRAAGDRMVKRLAEGKETFTGTGVGIAPAEK